MLMHATNGKGVDIVLNSLSGDLLDESWRCIADGGTMIEIGKQDMLERSSLSMESFTRNASYRAIDISHDSVPLSTIARLVLDPALDVRSMLNRGPNRLLSHIFKLVEEGHISPIHPRKIFSFSEVPDALCYMRGGNHIGKIVISDGIKRDIGVLV
jgi:NADPH:quinone reductase-like Zn-dependent oxidoreductase